MKTTVRLTNATTSNQQPPGLGRILFTALALLLMATAGAQTYTTQADGAWSSPATWVGGVVPSRTITTGMTVNIKHDVTGNLTGDLTISGVLNVEGDTLRFTSAFDKKIIINSTGLLSVKNGGLLQSMPGKKNELSMNGGRIVFDNAIVKISKNVTTTGNTRKFIQNSTFTIGEGYTFGGTSTSVRSIDTLRNAKLYIGTEGGGNFEAKSYSTVRVANASVVVNNGDFKTETTTDITVLSGAASNYGFNRIKVSKDLENKGAWDARIDAYCVDGNIKGSNMAAIDITRSEDCSDEATAGAAAPELVFSNPVLKSGTANKQGAVYRFANVTTGIDAEIKLKRFSRSDIVMRTIDNSTLGWGKAFQPEFGLSGVVKPNQNWYIDFEMTFYKAGTNQKQRVAKFDLTALDVDGDGHSVSEYANFENPSNVIYSTVSYLADQGAGIAGQSFTCPHDNLLGLVTPCLGCAGDGKAGLWNIDECTACEGVGLVYTLCGHTFDGVNGTTLSGPVENFMNIDTLATQVMATYQYVDKDKINFRYGGKSGSYSSNGSGIRLNSLWFRQFSMAPPPQVMVTLPVKLSAFEATLQSKDVQLSWTGYEVNFSHYIVQRSTDGKNYEDIAIVFGNNKTGSSSAYSYKDKNVVAASGMLYYRLLLLDKGQETSAKSSDVRVIRLKEAAGAQLTAYPNPVVDALRLTLPTAWQGKSVVIEVFSVNGNRLQNVLVGSASQTETLQMKTLPRGIYVVSATCNGEVAQQRIVKQ